MAKRRLAWSPRRQIGVVAAVAALSGCATVPSETTAPADRTAPSGSETRPTSTVATELVARSAEIELPNTQRLYRAQIEGESGQGGVRLTLRAVASGDFQIDAHDAFGRALWTLRFEAGAGLMIDHRNRIYCRYGTRVPLPEASLGDLPLASLPRVLLGWVPVIPVGQIDGSASGAAEYRDDEGGRWRVRAADGSLSTWTYFGHGDRPIVWWLRDKRGGGVLSHRDGTQLRWVESVAEDLVGGLTTMTIPDRYQECDV